MTEQMQPKPIDLKTAEGVKTLMTSSTSEEEWNKNCNQVKAINGGDYPNFWFPAILVSGIAKKTSDTWQK